MKRWEEFRFLPGAFESLAELHNAGYLVFVVTNQAAVNRGYLSHQEVEEINGRMAEEVRRNGGCIHEVLYCPHRPDEGCQCRKPRPGLLHTAAARHDIDLTRCYMVGDAISDIAAGQEAGCKTLLVLTGRGWKHFISSQARQFRGYRVVRNLTSAVKHILQEESRWNTAALPTTAASVASTVMLRTEPALAVRPARSAEPASSWEQHFTSAVQSAWPRQSNELREARKLVLAVTPPDGYQTMPQILEKEPETMDLDTCYQKVPAVVGRRIEDEVILVPIGRNIGDLQNIYTLNEVGACIWESIDGEKTLAGVVDVILDQFDVDRPQAEEDTVQFVHQLVEIGGVVPITSGATASLVT